MVKSNRVVLWFSTLWLTCHLHFITCRMMTWRHPIVCLHLQLMILWNLMNKVTHLHLGVLMSLLTPLHLGSSWLAVLYLNSRSLVNKVLHFHSPVYSSLLTMIAVLRCGSLLTSTSYSLGVTTFFVLIDPLVVEVFFLPLSLTILLLSFILSLILTSLLLNCFSPPI